MQGKEKADRSSRQEDTASLHTRNDPKAARVPKLPCRTAWVKRIGAHDV